MDTALVETLFEQADAARWELARAVFVRALDASVHKAFAGQEPEADTRDAYLRGLHLQDLALACACACGHERAWEYFIATHRAALYRAADAIARDGGGRDLADSLYADLFGLVTRDGTRQSLFRYFHGRSSLATWLRAVLSQRYVDRLRASRRTGPIPDDESPGALTSQPVSPEPDRARFVAAMRAALAAALLCLSSPDRLRIACYYAQRMTLAQIGRLLGEHESTVSRHLDRTRGVLRREIERQLTEVQHLAADEVHACFRSLADDAGPLDLEALLGQEARAAGAGAGRKNRSRDRSTEEPSA